MLMNVLKEIAYIFNESAIYILFGFFIAGLLKVTVSSEKILKHLGQKNLSSVVWASVLGIPIPLCSCAVLPTAMSLRKQGASKGATLSFLISTPETGVDSISITYALIDPVMTVFRPISALITAVTAGLAANRIDSKQSIDPGETENSLQNGCDESCSCEVQQGGQKNRIRELFHYAFVDLLNDIMFWLIIGIVIAGIISAAVPDTFFEDYLGSWFLSMIVMLIFGIPIYMCAASSTPIAAALILKGLNPGAALVFLLAGPATNVGTIAAVGRFLGRKMMAVYLGTIVIVSILLGFILNGIYAAMSITPYAIVGQASELLPYSLKVIGSIILIALMLYNLKNISLHHLIRLIKNRLHDLTGMR